MDRHYLASYKNEFTKNLDILYQASSSSDKSEDYAGSDIWKFFNNRLRNLMTKDKKTYVIVLTDGYFDFEEVADKKVVGKHYTYSDDILSFARTNGANWEKAINSQCMGLIPIKFDNPDLNILVLEVTPKQSITFYDEENLLKHIWTCWVAQMNIGSFKINEKQQISITKKVISDFLNDRIESKAECDLNCDLNTIQVTSTTNEPKSNSPEKPKEKNINTSTSSNDIDEKPIFQDSISSQTFDPKQLKNFLINAKASTKAEDFEDAQDFLNKASKIDNITLKMRSKIEKALGYIKNREKENAIAIIEETLNEIK